MADLKLFCLVDGGSTSNAFPVKITSTDTIADLRELIKIKKSPEFDDIAADKLTLWRVSIPVTDDNEDFPILLDNIRENEKRKLRATYKVSIFGATLPEETIHVIVQRPPSGNADAFCISIST